MYQVVHNQNKTEVLFKSHFLEKLSHVHPLTPIVFYTPVVFYFFYKASLIIPTISTMVFFILGIISWTLVEYILHRFIFHWPFVIKSRLGKRFHFLMHGVHHNYPRDSKRLVMPLLVSLPLAFVFYSLYSLIFTPYQDILFSGLVMGYILYDSTHFAIHHFSMRAPFLRWIKANHLSHHYIDHHKSFGVSSPAWDYVFGTYKATK